MAMDYNYGKFFKNWLYLWGCFKCWVDVPFVPRCSRLTTDRLHGCPSQPQGTSSLLWWFQKIPTLSNHIFILQHLIQRLCEVSNHSFKKGKLFVQILAGNIPMEISSETCQINNLIILPSSLKEEAQKTVAIQHWQCLWIRPWEKKLCGFSGKCVKRPQEGFWKSAKTVSVHDQPKVSRQRPMSFFIKVKSV